MARARSADRSPPGLHRSLSTPGMYLWRMFVFLILVGALCRLIKDESSRAALMAAATPEAFIATVLELENKLLGPVK